MSTLTLESLQSKSLAEIKSLIKNPATYPQMEAILRTPKGAAFMSELIQQSQKQEQAVLDAAAELDEKDLEAVAILEGDNNAPSTEQIAAESQASLDEENARIAAEQAAAASAARNQADDTALAAAGIITIRDDKGTVVRYIQEYQVTDANTGKPLGRPTHLEAATLPELVAKQRDTHVHATQALFQSRAINSKIKAAEAQKQPPVVLTEEQIEAIAREALGTGDSGKAREMVKAHIDEAVNKRVLAAQKAEAYANGQAMAMEFFSRHVADFYRCDANKQIIADYINDAGLEWTVDNMELAFDVNRDKLVPPPTSARAEITVPPANHPVVTTEVAAPPANQAVSVPVTPAQPTAAPAQPAVSQPAASAPQTVSAPPNKVHVANRAGVNVGIEPGSLSAKRHVPTAAPRLTKADVKNMKPEELRQKLRDANFVKDFEALGFKAR